MMFIAPTGYDVVVGDWGFLSNHARTMVFIAGQPDARLRDMAAALEVTERTVFGIVADLTEAGYLVKERVGRRNCYYIQGHLPLHDPTISGTPTISQLLSILVDQSVSKGSNGTRTEV